MKNLQTHSLLIPVFTFLLLVLSSCLPKNEEIDQAFIDLTVEFTDSGTMTPITNTRIDIFTRHTTSDDFFYQGPAGTDNNGLIDGFLSSPDESTVNRMRFIFTVDDEEFTVEEDVDAQFRFEEPFETIHLLFEVEVTEPEQQ